MTAKRIRIVPAIIQLSVFLILLSQNIYGQNPLSELRVSLKYNNKVLHTLLDDLTDQTGYYFTFDSRIINGNQRISCLAREILLKDALDSIFRNPELNYQLINKNIVIYPKNKEPDSLYIYNEEIKYKQIHGIVIDNKSEKSLPYATIGVMDSNFGTITNLNGRFVLQIPNSIQEPILLISFIGYRNHYVPISIDSEKVLKIQMNRNLISLQEVIIRYQDPLSLLSESIKRIDENYMNEPAGAIGYYRERVQKNDKCLIFSEAVIEIDKASYSSGNSLERTRILRGRKITNVDLSDTVILKIKSGIASMLELDIVKKLPDFLSENFIFRYNYSFANIVSYEDKLVYVIRFSPKEEIDETLFRGKIYIDRESLAIVAADFEYDPVRIGKEQNMFVSKKSKRLHIRPLGAFYHVEYKNSSEGYHLNQVRGEVSFKVRKKRQWIASKYTIKLAMAITEIDPGNPLQIKSNEKIKPNVIMSDQQYTYDPDFWGEFNIIAPELSLQEALKRIGKSMQEVSVR